MVENFKRLIEGQSDTARMLIENGILSDNVFLAEMCIRDRCRALAPPMGGLGGLGSSDGHSVLKVLV